MTEYELTGDAYHAYANAITAGAALLAPGIALVIIGFFIGLSPPVPEPPVEYAIMFTPEMARAALKGGVIFGIGGVLAITGGQVLYKAGKMRSEYSSSSEGGESR